MTWMLKIGAILTGLLIVAGVCWFFDLPAFPDAPPWTLAKVLAGTEARCFEYFLGGYIDTESAWRIDGSAKTIEAIVDELQLQESHTIPASFWRMPPHYWPGTEKRGMKAYRSLDFDADERGPDGMHYFLVHDQEAGRAFLWIKDNF